MVVVFKTEIIVLCAFLVFAAVAIWASRGWRKRRLEALRRVAGALGLSFEGRSASFVIPGAKQFRLLRRGGMVDELMRGQRHGRAIAVFRHILVVHYGQGATVSFARVAAFQAGGHLPTFQIRHQSWLTRLKRRLRRRDIIFATHPEVTRRFYVTASDSNAVRAFFDGQVLSQLTTVPAGKFTVEASGTWLLVYCHGLRDWKPDAIPVFLEQAEILARIFLDRVEPKTHSFSRVASGMRSSVR
ncbi:MAG TPA: hypothetical protein VJA94_22660 [Candidatus Angelobacter sp.]